MNEKITKKIVPAKELIKTNIWRAKKSNGFKENRKYSYLGSKKISTQLFKSRAELVMSCGWHWTSSYSAIQGAWANKVPLSLTLLVAK